MHRRRHIVNCRKREANQARYKAFLETRKLLRLRKRMWQRVQLLLFKEKLMASRWKIAYVSGVLFVGGIYIHYLPIWAEMYARLLK